jgi:hypothetical protein
VVGDLGICIEGDNEGGVYEVAGGVPDGEVKDGGMRELLRGSAGTDCRCPPPRPGIADLMLRAITASPRVCRRLEFTPADIAPGGGDGAARRLLELAEFTVTGKGEAGSGRISGRLTSSCTGGGGCSDRKFCRSKIQFHLEEKVSVGYEVSGCSSFLTYGLP